MRNDWKPLFTANFLKNVLSALRLSALGFYEVIVEFSLIASHCLGEEPAAKKVA